MHCDNHAGAKRADRRDYNPPMSAQPVHHAILEVAVLPANPILLVL